MADLRGLRAARRGQLARAARAAAALAAVAVLFHLASPRAWAQQPQPRGPPAGPGSLSRRSAWLLGASAAAAPQAAKAALSEDEHRVVALFERASPSVLGVSAVPPHDGASLLERSASIAGSAFAWDDQHVITSLQVLDACNSATPYVTITGRDANGDETRRSFPAKTVGADPSSRVAVLRLEGAPADFLRPLEMGSSTDLRVGQDVYAIGSPYGLEQSLSHGTVGGVSRQIQGANGAPVGMIQIGGSLSGGYSGGPLLDSLGRVVGVNSAATPGGRFVGLGWAVPIETVARRVGDVIQKGFVERPWLGASLADDQLVTTLGVKGAMVLKVVPSGPASTAGIRPMHGGVLGDVIVGIGGKSCITREEALGLLGEYVPGEEVVFSVRRPSSTLILAGGGGAKVSEAEFETLDVKVKLGSTEAKVTL